MELKKLTINKIYRNTTDREGNELKNRDGRPYTRVVLQTKEYPSDKISGFGTPENEAWKEGDVVEVLIEEKGNYVNFKMPKKEDKNPEVLNKILNAMTALRIDIEIIKEHVVKKREPLVVDDQTFEDTDVPFDDDSAF